MWKLAKASDPDHKVEYALVGSIAAACSLLRKNKNSTPHVLLVAMDAASASDKDLGTLAAAIVDSHCFWMCAWGPACNVVDDAVDTDIVMREIYGLLLGRSVITTWHDKETLRSAVWSACHTAMPSDEWNIETWTRRVLVIGGIVSEESLVHDIETMDDEISETHG